MSESKMISEREAVLRERAAFCFGAGYFTESRQPHGGVEAARLYPLTKVERPRRVPDPHSGLIFWTTTIARIDSGSGRVVTLASDGRFGGEFRDVDVTFARMAVWADLLANPTEWVEAES